MPHAHNDAETRLSAARLAHLSWAKTPDRAARTAPARAGLMAKFEREADPDGTLDPAERTKRAEHLRKAFYLDMSRRAAEARRVRKDAA